MKQQPSVRSRLVMLITVIAVFAAMFVMVPSDQRVSSLVYIAPAIVVAYGTFVTGETKRPSGVVPSSFSPVATPPATGAGPTSEVGD